jgi:hypothetical protein
MVNNSTNINTTNNHHWTQIIEHKYTTHMTLQIHQYYCLIAFWLSNNILVLRNIAARFECSYMAICKAPTLSIILNLTYNRNHFSNRHSWLEQLYMYIMNWWPERVLGVGVAASYREEAYLYTHNSNNQSTFCN